MNSNTDSSTLWAWSLTILGLVLSLSSFLGEELRILLLCVGLALMLQAIPVWLMGQYLGRRRRRRALEFVERIGGRIVTRLAADPSQILGIDLSNTRIQNSDLDYLNGFSGLERLNLAHTDIDGEGVELLVSLRWLRDIDLSHTRVGDVGLKRLAALQRLQQVHLAGTEITPDGLAEFIWRRADVEIHPRGLLTTLDGIRV
ncbi:leucine-rich repeat domain-containing protein [Thalassoroseus pseudoceratinae]|uniref:hypothetical protein n=1 Tax=Thalassoroseus pseudoceratinae TaxID=2713176 RepID=UPI00141DB325|nr:hypothetical protein [Thalassoroseus pseudoceratinae]